jgi:hypothetical protein
MFAAVSGATQISIKQARRGAGMIYRHCYIVPGVNFWCSFLLVASKPESNGERAAETAAKQRPLADGSAEKWPDGDSKSQTDATKKQDA